MDEEPVVEEPIAEESEVSAEAAREESTTISSKKVGEDGLCEDYFFEQGDTLEILDHMVTVDRIGESGLRMTVDGQRYVLNTGDTEYAGDGIQVSLAPNNVFYFAADDPANGVQLRVGCRYDRNPNEKYIEDNGERICRQIYYDCQDAFDIDLDE